MHEVVLRLDEADEVARYGLSHVQQLEEAVLRVGATLAEVDLAHGVVHRLALKGHPLAVRLHVYLLDVRGKLA